MWHCDAKSLAIQVERYEPLSRAGFQEFSLFWGDFPDCSFSSFPGLLIVFQAPTRNSPERVSDTIWTKKKVVKFLPFSTVLVIFCSERNLSSPMRDNTPFRTIPFQESIAERALHVFCLLSCGIAHVSLEKVGSSRLTFSQHSSELSKRG